MDRVYVLKIKLRCDEPKYVYKIGKTSTGKYNKRSSIDRVLEIQRSYYQKYRYTFFCEIKRDRATENAFEIETKLHQMFKEYSFYVSPEKSFDGSTELFDIEEHKILKAFDELLPLKGKTDAKQK